MKFFTLTSAALFISVSAFAEEAGNRASFYEYCVSKEKAPKGFCQCAVDEHFLEIMNTTLLPLKGSLDIIHKDSNARKARALSDPVMTVDRVNEICDVADQYSTFLPGFSQFQDGILYRYSLTDAQKKAVLSRDVEIQKNVSILHDKYGSNNSTRNVLRDAFSGYCVQRYNLEKAERKYGEHREKVEAGNVSVEFSAVIRRGTRPDSPCRVLKR